MKKPVGILALQGAFEKHREILASIGLESILIRKANELNACSALIIPGGESTSISLLIQEYGLYEPIKVFAESHPVMGVCAGMIMMATEVDDERVEPLGLIPFKALRNHYGRQLDSFSADIKLNFSEKPLHAHFIRAPGISQLSDDTQTLATNNDEVVMIKKGKHVALSFHPELTGDSRVHAYWLNTSLQ